MRQCLCRIFSLLMAFAIVLPLFAVPVKADMNEVSMAVPGVEFRMEDVGDIGGETVYKLICSVSGANDGIIILETWLNYDNTIIVPYGSSETGMVSLIPHGIYEASTDKIPLGARTTVRYTLFTTETDDNNIAYSGDCFEFRFTLSDGMTVADMNNESFYIRNISDETGDNMAMTISTKSGVFTYYNEGSGIGIGIEDDFTPVLTYVNSDKEPGNGEYPPKTISLSASPDASGIVLDLRNIEPSADFDREYNRYGIYWETARVGYRLVLHDAEITFGVGTEFGIVVPYNTEITLLGNNTFYSAEQDTLRCAVYAPSSGGSLNFTGDGNLVIDMNGGASGVCANYLTSVTVKDTELIVLNASNSGIGYYGESAAYSAFTVVIDNASVSVFGISFALKSGISTSGGVSIVNNSNVNVYSFVENASDSGINAGILLEKGDITIRDSLIEITNFGFGICAFDGNVTLDGGEIVLGSIKTYGIEAGETITIGGNLFFMPYGTGKLFGNKQYEADGGLIYQRQTAQTAPFTVSLEPGNAIYSDGSWLLVLEGAGIVVGSGEGKVYANAINITEANSYSFNNDETFAHGIYWDSISKTLTLNNATVSTAAPPVTLPAGATVLLIGENTVEYTGTDGNISALKVLGECSITNGKNQKTDAKLVINAVNGIGISIGNSHLIEYCEVSVNARNEGITVGSGTDAAKRRLTVRDSKVTVTVTKGRPAISGALNAVNSEFIFQNSGLITSPVQIVSDIYSTYYFADSTSYSGETVSPGEYFHIGGKMVSVDFDGFFVGFYGNGGEQLCTRSFGFGEEAAYPDSVPYMASNSDYDYVFSHWEYSDGTEVLLSGIESSCNVYAVFSKELKPFVAKSGDTGYRTVQAAVNAAPDGGLVELMGDSIEQTVRIPRGKTLTIDLYDYNITALYSYDPVSVSLYDDIGCISAICNEGILTIKGTGTVTAPVATHALTDYSCALYNKGGIISVEGGVFVGGAFDEGNESFIRCSAGLINAYGGVVNYIYGGTFKNDESNTAYTPYGVLSDGGLLGEISGGTFMGISVGLVADNSKINVISGGEFIGKNAVQINNSKIETISGGLFRGSRNGVIISSSCISSVSGGVFTGGMGYAVFSDDSLADIFGANSITVGGGLFRGEAGEFYGDIIFTNMIGITGQYAVGLYEGYSYVTIPREDYGLSVTMEFIGGGVHYNPGDTFLVGIYAGVGEETERTVGIGYLSFNLTGCESYYDFVGISEADGLSDTADINITGNAFEFTDTAATGSNADAGIIVGTEPVLVAIAEFKVKQEFSSVNGEVNGDITLVMSDILKNDSATQLISNSGDTITASLHDIKVTFEGSPHAGIIGGNAEFSVRYGETLPQTLSLPIPAAAEGYRLRDESNDEKLWNDGTSDYSSSEIKMIAFSRSKTFTPNTVKQWDVSFVAGVNGSLTAGGFTVDDGYTLTDGEIPVPVPDTGCEFSHWSPDPYTVAINTDTVFTANFERTKYSVTFPEGIPGVTVNTVSGISDGEAVYGTSIVFTATAIETIKINAVTYAVGSSSPVEIEETDGVYVVPGDVITGNVMIVIDVENLHIVTIATSGNGTVESVTFYIGDGEFLTRTQLGEITLMPALGYKFAGWCVGESDVNPEDYAINQNVTFIAIFEPGVFTVTFPDGINQNAVYLGNGISFTPEPSDGKLVVDVFYQIGSNTQVALDANADGSYTLPGSAVTGNINVIYREIAGEIVYIGKEDFCVLNEDEIIVAVKTEKLTDNYTLTYPDGIYWLEGLSAYSFIAQIGDVVDEAIISARLKIESGGNAADRKNGDIDGDGDVTVADAALVNDMLHGTTDGIPDVSRLGADVNGDGRVSTADILYILEIAGIEGVL